MSYDNTDTGVLFKNERKERENQPDYTGKINVSGVEKRLAAWIKDGRKGKFMSLKVSDFREAAAAPAERPPARADLDDEIPF